jgi:3-dehydroquinate synthase
MLAARNHSVTLPARPDEIRVDLGARAYSVVVGTGLLPELGERLAALGLTGRCAIVTNETVGALYLAPVEESLRGAGFEPIVVTVPDGESHKSRASLDRIYDRLLPMGIDRRTPLVALGGGVVGDLTGFAAATLLRGVPVVQVPTTLLAQVDAAIGGKTAINHPAGKNLVGAFHQPRLVVADVATLRTLPERELLAGLAEVVKYGVIGDARLFGRLEDQAPALLAREPDVLVAAVTASARQKAAVVAADEREEGGERAVLNFGHTVGHALEAVTDYRRYLHGEAVAVGMVAAARVSHALGVCDAEVGTRIERLLSGLGLPTAVPAELRTPALAAAMQRDKKSRSGRIRFVAVETIGRTRFVDIDGSEILKLL